MDKFNVTVSSCKMHSDGLKTDTKFFFRLDMAPHMHWEELALVELHKSIAQSLYQFDVELVKQGAAMGTQIDVVLIPGGKCM